MGAHQKAMPNHSAGGAPSSFLLLAAKGVRVLRSGRRHQGLVLRLVGKSSKVSAIGALNTFQKSTV